MKETDGLFRFYSQHGEDCLLWEFFDYKAKGFYIDVGAFDGVHLSNSYSFELKGWKGVCVEPHPDYFDFCKANRPKSLCVNAACVADAETSDIIFEIEKTGLFSSVKLDRSGPNIIGHYESLGMEDLAQESISVRASTLNSILSKNFKKKLDIDFVSIDVEGCEIDVLSGFDLHIYRPRVLVIETNNEIEKKKVDMYLEKFGYFFARQVNVNSFYVNSDNDIQKLQGISLNCVIEKQIHPRGIEYTIKEFAEGKVIYDGESIDKKISHLVKENERLKSSEELVVGYQNKQKKFNGWLEDYKEKNKQKTSKISKLNAKLEELKPLVRENGRLVKENARLKRFEDLVVEYQDKQKKFNGWLEDYKEKNKQKTSKISKLNAKLEELKPLVKENERLSGAEELVVEYQNKLKKFNLWLEDYKERIEQKNIQIATLKDLVAKYQDKQKEFNSWIEDYKCRIKQKNKKIADLNAKLKE